MRKILIGVKFDSNTSALIMRNIDDAEAEINKHISRRYDVSTLTSPVPPLLKKLCGQLTEGYYYCRASRGGKESIARGKDLIKMALENLKELKNYDADLLDPAGSLISDKANSKFQMTSTSSDYSNTFNEDNPLNWVVDCDKLDDIESERD